jgi:hypothetical protein
MMFRYLYDRIQDSEEKKMTGKNITYYIFYMDVTESQNSNIVINMSSMGRKNPQWV